MDASEFYKFEDRAYINPTLSSGEQEAFINNFRDIQNRNNQQIATDTYNLGKALPSNLGGLGGGESYFNSRYQKNQVDDMVANLTTAAKAQSLTDVMSNYQNQLKQRYSKAQQAYNRRKASSSGTSSIEDAIRKLTGALSGSGAKGTVTETNSSAGNGTTVQRLKTSPTNNSQSTVASGRYYYTYDDDTGLVVGTSDPTYKKFGDIYVPNNVYDQMFNASLIPFYGEDAVKNILQQYINSR